jgi:hypothetical protein
VTGSIHMVYLYILPLYKFIDYRHHLYISHMSPDAGPSGPKYVVHETTKIFVSLTEKHFHFYMEHRILPPSSGSKWLVFSVSCLSKIIFVMLWRMVISWLTVQC